MSSNFDKIHEFYSSGREDARSTVSRTSALEFHYTKRHLEGIINKESKVLEIGCATGFYGFYYADKCKEYVGVDIVAEHIALFKSKIANSKIDNLSCAVGDATNLKDIENDSFDVVLCLGPMYHLPAEERELVFAQCNRVCKKNGIVAIAYINKIGAYFGACVELSNKYPNEETNECILGKGIDDDRPGVFHFSTPEEMNETASKYGLTKIKNLATDFFIAMGIINSMTDEKFEIMRPLYDKMTSSESCTGMSNHALLVCRK